jgi:hypothetical protein
MKKFFISAMFLLMAISPFCQQSGSGQSLSQQDYLQKSKRQKTAAWIMLGGGVVLAAGSAILAVSSDWSKPETPYDVAIYAGGASILGSIPLFIASGRNKRKAMNASTYFEIRRNPVTTGTGLTLRSMPTLSLKFNF